MAVSFGRPDERPGVRFRGENYPPDPAPSRVVGLRKSPVRISGIHKEKSAAAQ